jgi:hypothetical protein
MNELQRDRNKEEMYAHEREGEWGKNAQFNWKHPLKTLPSVQTIKLTNRLYKKTKINIHHPFVQ